MNVSELQLGGKKGKKRVKPGGSIHARIHQITGPRSWTGRVQDFGVHGKMYYHGNKMFALWEKNQVC